MADADTCCPPGPSRVASHQGLHPCPLAHRAAARRTLHQGPLSLGLPHWEEDCSSREKGALLGGARRGFYFQPSLDLFPFHADKLAQNSSHSAALKARSRGGSTLHWASRTRRRPWGAGDPPWLSRPQGRPGTGGLKFWSQKQPSQALNTSQNGKRELQRQIKSA